MKPKKNTSMKQVQVRNSSFSDKLDFPVYSTYIFSQLKFFDSFFSFMFIQRFIHI